jgi:hypothetical protein
MKFVALATLAALLAVAHAEADIQARHLRVAEQQYHASAKMESQTWGKYIKAPAPKMEAAHRFNPLHFFHAKAPARMEAQHQDAHAKTAVQVGTQHRA